MGKVEPGVLVMVRANMVNPAHRSHAGEVRTVQGRGRHPNDPAWLLEGIPWLEFADHNLIVMGNPGPDEVDETLRSKETV